MPTFKGESFVNFKQGELKMKLIAMTALILLSTQSFAAVGPLVCSNGVIGEDSYIEVLINENNVQFNLHETHFEAADANLVSNGNTWAVLNRELQGTAEGDEFKAIINALLVFNPERNSLNLTLLIDGDVQTASSELTCK